MAQVALTSWSPRRVSKRPMTSRRSSSQMLRKRSVYGRSAVPHINSKSMLRVNTAFSKRSCTIADVISSSIRVDTVEVITEGLPLSEGKHRTIGALPAVGAGGVELVEIGDQQAVLRAVIDADKAAPLIVGPGGKSEDVVADCPRALAA